MGTLSIIGLIFSVIMSGVGIAAQAHANKQNIELANTNREDEQQFAHEEAEIARQANVEQYNELYSPQAKVRQYEEAGLSPALMYGNGAAQGAAGVTTQMANTPSHSAPYVNPLLNMNGDNPVTSAIQNLQGIEDIKKTKAETKNVEENTKLVTQKIDESKKLVEEMESEIGCNIVTKHNDELRTKLIENEVKLSNETLDEQINIVKKNLELLETTQNKMKEEIEILQIEKDKKAEYLQASIDLMNAERVKYCAETLLAAAETSLARIKYKLTQTEINLNIVERQRIKQEIEEKEIELTKLRNSPLWGEKGMDRLTGLALTLGETTSNFVNEVEKMIGETEKNIGKGLHKGLENWWENNKYELEQGYNGNWVPLIDNFFATPYQRKNNHKKR